MRCPACHAELPADAVFCGHCGGALSVERHCAACGRSNPPDMRFCLGCGTPLASAAPPRTARAATPKHLADKILGARSALEGERKQVTVLFADVKGSMQLAEQLDPEEWHGIMDRFFQILAEGVHRFEGTVNQYTGDGIMALFGAPLAHEDHAQRGCWAALHLGDELRRYAEELKRTRGLRFAVRMGLNSGEVVVGRIGDDLHMDYTAHGHTVGLASRMEQLADPGKVYLTEHTAALVADYVQLRDLGPFTIKGVSDTLHVFELVGPGTARTRLDVSRSRGFSRFVGRGDEMAILERALAKALAGDAQVVGVVAEAGTGKSRLCHEFAERCRARGITIDGARGVAHGKNIPFLPVLEYLRGYFAISERDTGQPAREKIAGKLLLLDATFAEDLPLLFDFLGVPDPNRPPPVLDPEARQRQLFAVMKRLIHARSRREPSVNVIEDLHWIDGASEAFLENFVDAIVGTRTLIVVNFRPEYRVEWMRKAHYQQVGLHPLGAEATAELLADLLGPDVPAALGERLHRRSGGNPFFIEELVQGLVGSGHLVGARGAYRIARPVDDAALPATVQAVLAARIDRLDEVDKGVLQTAAVIGKEFAEPVLRRIAELPEIDLAGVLARLTRAELLYEAALYPAAEYAFKHPLTQEVAYHSQLAERRRRVHRAAARAFLDVYADKLDEKAAMLAYHWDAAGETFEAARWHRRAANWSAASDMREGLRHWQRVRALADTIADSAEAASLGLQARTGILNCGWRLGFSVDEVDELVTEGRAIAASLDVPAELARLLLATGVAQGMAGNVALWRVLAEEAQELADQSTDPIPRIGARMALAYTRLLTGPLEDSLAFFAAAAELLPEDVWAGTELYGFPPRVAIADWCGSVLISMGRFEEAERASDRAFELALRIGATENLGWLSGDRADLEGARGNVVAALDNAARAVDVAEKVGTAFSRLVAAMNYGEALVLAERYADAVPILETAVAQLRAGRVAIVFEGRMLGALSAAYLGRGEPERARAAAEQALAIAARTGARHYEVQPWLALARALLAIDGPAGRAAVERALDQATVLGEQLGVRRWQPWVHLTRAGLAAALGDDAARRREIATARRLYERMGATARAAALLEHEG